MQKDDLYGWMQNPGALGAATLDALREAVEEYPCFHTARLLYTKNLRLANSLGYEDELGKTAILCNDRKKLFYLIYREEYGELLHKNEPAQLHGNDRTEELLESFLSSLGEMEMIEPAIENAGLNLAATDYLTFLKLQGEDESESGGGDQKLRHQDIIDAFIEKAKSDVLFVPLETEPSGERQDADEKEEGGDFLTETLARVYIKQKKYAQALTTIKRLSLNFPKKSVYFAHQIRFLELLIINEKTKNK
jgi:hypothetical protein